NGAARARNCSTVHWCRGSWRKSSATSGPVSAMMTRSGTEIFRVLRVRQKVARPINAADKILYQVVRTRRSTGMASTNALLQRLADDVRLGHALLLRLRR